MADGRGRPRLIEDKVADKIVAAYQNGTKIAQIERDFDVARATIYWLLERRGIGSDRAKRNLRLQVDRITAAHLYDLIAEQEQTISLLEQEIERLRQVLDGTM